MKKRNVFLFIFIFIFIGTTIIHAQESESDLQKKIEEYQQKLTEIRTEKNTLSSQIDYMDTQIYLTQLKIKDTEQKIVQTQKEIETLGSRIEGLDSSLSYLSKLLLEKVVESYKQRSLSLIDYLLNTASAGDFLAKVKYLKTTQNNNQKIVVQVQQAKLNFEEQKTLREQKKIELDQLNITLGEQENQLTSQQNAKKILLAETQNSESVYQNLLTQAQRQLAAFSSFTSNQGGASILNNQTVCDDWGCYYSQRDAQWGDNALNGTGYTLAGEGCLVTSVAMIYTHYGHRDVNPQTINSNSNNFASYYPAYLNFTVVANGVSSTRINSSIDNELNGGTPVIVGVDYDGNGNPDHFVVLISGSGGNYQMNDPFTPNGHNIPFDSKYSVGSIVTVQKVSI